MHSARPDAQRETRSQTGPPAGRARRRAPGRAPVRAGTDRRGGGGRRGGSGGRGGGSGGRGGGRGNGPPGGRPSGGGRSGRPGRPPRRRGSRVPTWLKVAVGLLSLLLLAISASATALVMYGRSNIEQTTIEGISPGRGRTVTLEGGGSIEIVNVLLVGTDSPGSLTEAQRARVAPDERSGRRPDTLILAQLEVGGTGGALLSIPRDLRLELCDGRVNKINASFAVAAGAGKEPESCLVQTITGYTGIEIDHYVEVGFAGFLRVIEALGGVTMYLDQPMIDRKAHLDVPAGCVTLTPEQALGFVRSRGYDDDFGRMARQQRFLREVVDEAVKLGVVANPARLFALVDRASRAVRTDDGLGLSEMRDLALGLRNLNFSSLVTHAVPSEPATISGVAYVVAQEEEAQALFTSFRDGSVLAPVASGEPVPPPDSEATAAAELTPAEISPIVVLNASDTSGLAARTAEMLEGAGFRVADVGNADARQDRTEVLHGTGLEDQGEAVATLFGDATLRHAGGGPPLTILLGEDLDPARVEELRDEARAHEVATSGDGAGGDPPSTSGSGGDQPVRGEGDASRDAGAAEATQTEAVETIQDGTAAAETQQPAFRAAERPDGVDC